MTAPQITTDAPLTPEAATALVDRIATGLERLDADVAAAYHGAAHVALGYGSGAKGWAALCRDRLAGAEWLAVKPGPQRLEKVQQLRQQRMPTRAIGDALGVSAATVVSDLRQLEAAGVDLPTNVVSLDGRRRSATGTRRGDMGGDVAVTQPATPLVIPEGLTELMRLAWLAVAGEGEAGLTQLELERVAGWRQGRCTSLLFRLRTAGLIRTEDAKRDGYRVHVAVLPD